MESTLTGNRDTDRLILLNLLDDQDLFRACRTDRYTASLCNKEFWQAKVNRILGRRVVYTDPQTLYSKVRTSKNDETLLVWAASIGLTSLVELLLDRGVDIHYRNDAPLRWAVTNGHRSVLTLLIKRGADPSAQNDEAIKRAVQTGNEEILTILLNAGVDPVYDIQELLRIATDKGYDAILRLLMKTSAARGNPIILNNLLIQTVSKQNYDLIDDLVALHVDINSNPAELIDAIIRTQSIALLDYLFARGLRVEEDTVPHIFFSLVGYGLFEMLSFFFVHFPTLMVSFRNLRHGIVLAARRNDVVMLRFLLGLKDQITDYPFDLSDKTIRELLIADALRDEDVLRAAQIISLLLNRSTEEELTELERMKIVSSPYRNILMESFNSEDSDYHITQEQYDRLIRLTKSGHYNDDISSLVYAASQIPHSSAQLLFLATKDRHYALITQLLNLSIALDGFYVALRESITMRDTKAEEILLKDLDPEALQDLFLYALELPEYPHVDYGMVDLLIRHGVDVHVENDLAVDLAKRYGDQELLDLLESVEE